MDVYLFLFGVAFVWIVFATVQDLRTREVSNWLNFSLLAIALGYRFLYALESGLWEFFYFGVLGVGLFFLLALGFYYGKVFAGGDAKLLMALGAVMPFDAWGDFLVVGGGFVLLLLGVGAMYSLIYSGFIMAPQFKEFWGPFSRRLMKEKWLIAGCVFLGGVLGLVARTKVVGSVVFILVSSIPLLYCYLQVFERKFMIQLTPTRALREGDWLVKDVHVRGRVIRANVHGLSTEEVRFLARQKDLKILIRNGVPFVPAFFGAFVLMVWVFLGSVFDYRIVFSFLY